MSDKCHLFCEKSPLLLCNSKLIAHFELRSKVLPFGISQINLEIHLLIRTFALCMVLNWIWVGFFIIAFVIALVKLVFLGDFEVFPAMMDSTFSSSKTAFEISLGLTGVLALWLGIMKIGEKGGVRAGSTAEPCVRQAVS